MTVDEARRLAERELADALPRRWRHVQGVAARAADLGALVGSDLEVIQSAAWLHDIGYAPSAVDTGFHPLDGARFLRRSGVDARIVTLVAHHAFARIEADERGLAGQLASEFGWEDSPTADLLTYCDLTTGPDGQRVTPVERLAEIRQRYGPDDPMHRFIVRAEEAILSTCDRVENRLHRGPGPRVPDWQQFLNDVPWFHQRGPTAVVGAERAWDRGTADDLPNLSALLSSATVTPVSMAGRQYELLAWGPGDNRRGWLAAPPHNQSVDHVPAVHRTFWSLCGGIVKRFNEPLSWWNNQSEVLTASAARMPLAEFMADCTFLWQDAGLEVSIDFDHYYIVAPETSAMTIASRDTGQLLLFSQDHNFPDVTPVPRCPPYTLHTIDGLPDLASWLEACAATWLDG